MSRAEPTPQASTAEPLVAAYAGVVCDLDGVVYRGPTAIPYAVPTLRGIRERVPVVFATNNASRTAESVAEHLTHIGLETLVGDVVTSAFAGAAELARRLPAGARVLPVGGPGVPAALRSVGLAPTLEGDVDGVLQGWGAQVSATDLGAAAIAVARGAIWVATNRDLTLPTEAGLVPGNGTLVAAVATASGREPIVVGKPGPSLYHEVAARLGLAPTRLLAVGDRLDTDVAGAQAAGMDSAWVLTGVDGFASLARSTATPTYAVADLRGLLSPIAHVHRSGFTWESGGVRIHVRRADGGVEVTTRQRFSREADGESSSAVVALGHRIVCDLRSSAELEPDLLARVGTNLDACRTQ